MKKFILCAVLGCTYIFAHAQSWLLSGNSGTTPGTNYLGTTDAKALVFKVNNQQSGYIDFSTGKANTGFGFQTLKNNTGSSNTAFGYKASFSNTTGKNNLAAGAYALYFNTTGYSNIALGIGAMYRNTNISNTVAIGDSALYNNGTDESFSDNAIYNTAVGSKSLYNNTGGSYNSAIGYNTLFSNTGGFDCDAMGYQSLYNNTTGSNNIGVGSYSLYKNEIGNYNTATGFSALYNNTSSCNTAFGCNSLDNNSSGAFNTATGYNSLLINTTGDYNTSSGGYALYSNNTGSFNTGVGFFALGLTTTSQFNTAIGYYAGHNHDNGFNNVFVGANVDVNGADYYNVIAIGQGTICTGSSQVTMGNGATGVYRAYANWSNISDGRFKKNIKQNVPGLVFINKLQPITYTLDATGIDNFLHADQPEDKQAGGQAKALMNKALAEKEKIIYTGFIAQDVEKAAKSLNYDFSGVDAAKNDKDVYGLRYAEFVVPLVKAVQELSKQNDSLKQSNNELETKYDNQQKEIDAIKSMIGADNASSINSLQPAILSSSSLQQNVPNPFTNSTTISYSIPQKFASAKIVVTNKNGVALQQFNLSSGNGSVIINASTLSSGTYQYSLYIDGRTVDSKQMIVAK